LSRNLYACLIAVILPALAPCQSARRLAGKVLLPDGKPAQGAVVKLQDQSKGIRTALSTTDGSFQFSGLLPDLDYEVRADLGGMESNRVRWSHLSSRKEKDVTLILRLVRKSGTSSALYLPLSAAERPSDHRFASRALLE
jgi:Carboxypeptidase regulatory-like domain